jgi:dihydrofolate synthase/folylpolyglutamate synthase
VLDRLFALEAFGIKLGLDNISRLCAALGHPERSFTSIHVAGTNGKGSVTAMVHAALAAAGMCAGRFTSPHLSDLSERFVIGSAPVRSEELERAATDVLDCVDRLRASGELPVQPTFFEATTAIGFELFRRSGVEVAVVEVGLGGRFDATNVVPASVGAITSIGLDHQEQLGDTLAAIAREKAGIVKPGMTVVTGLLPDEARAVVHATVAERGARLVEAAEGVRLEHERRDGRTVLTMETPEDRYGPVVLALRGDHQIGNASVAVRLIEAARSAGVRVSRGAIEAGLRDVVWPGRMEVFELPGGGRVLLDAAHNPDGARALAAYIARGLPGRPALVFGAMRDKDVDGMIRALLPLVSSVIATAADTPRAIPAEHLSVRIEALGAPVPVRAEPRPVVALEQALALGGPVCVTGSILLVGAVRGALEHRAILR